MNNQSQNKKNSTHKTITGFSNEYWEISWKECVSVDFEGSIYQENEKYNFRFG